MNVVFVGGGSYMNLPILRSALADGSFTPRSSIRLVDRVVPRAETVGLLVKKTPEYAAVGCDVRWSDDLDAALDGADAVYVTMAVGSPDVLRRSEQASLGRGFMPSDNLSLSGGFRSLTGAVPILDIARRMERQCPRAWMLIFANPIAVFSAMVNNHTKIRALGLCGGASNYRWDVTRMLGKDVYRDAYDVHAAGVNHFSFLLSGTYQGKDLYEVLRRRLKPGWTPPPIKQHQKGQVQQALLRQAEMLRRFGFINFSAEGDGQAHLDHEAAVERACKRRRRASEQEIRASGKAVRLAREESDRAYRAYAERDLPASFWKTVDERWLARNDGAVALPIFRVLSGGGAEKIVASHPNRGAVDGFCDRTVLEYSMDFSRRGVKAAGTGYAVPAMMQGMVSSLANFQTLLGDANAIRDPKLLAEALFAYPIRQNSAAARGLWNDLLRIHRREIPDAFQRAREYF